jgi:hypothetical protein
MNALVEQREWREPGERHNPPNQVTLQLALRALRGIRQRYETGRVARPDARRYSQHVVVNYSDMAWITAAIEALEKVITSPVITGRAPEAVGPAAIATEFVIACLAQHKEQP